MIKILYFIPAVLALIFYGVLAFAGGLGAINPAVWFFVALLIISAILMSQNKWWGSILGIVVGITLIYMSTQYTGQPIDIEKPIGIVFCVYYLICGFSLFRKNNK